MAVEIIGIILILTHFLDTCPLIAWVGAGITMFGAFGFSDTKNKDYRKKGIDSINRL